MKKLIIPMVVLIVAFVFSSMLLNISKTLPEGTVIPLEVREIIDEDKLDNTINYSNFNYGWYFFDNIFGFIVVGTILMLGISGKIRDRAKNMAEKITAMPNAPLIVGSVAAFVAMLLAFLSATPDHPVSGGTLGIALAWGVVGMFVGKSSRFALTTLYILLFTLLMDVLNFPFAYYKGFVVEHYFELSNETLSKWLADFLKSNTIGYLFSVLLIPLAYWGIRKSPKFWWAWISAGFVPIIVCLLVISPVYLAPLFDKYEELKDETLKSRLTSMAEEAGISGSRVFQVDKSDETSKISAFVTGLFGSKRIVLWDTMLDKLEHDEIAFVMGHEMGHYVLNHVWKFIGFFTGVLLALLFIISKTIGLVIRKFGHKMGFTELSDIASFPLLMFMLSLMMFILSPALNGYSRMNEHDADVFGLDLTHNGNIAASAFAKLANENLSNPSPPAFIEFWLFSHPTLKDRIDFCKEYAPVMEENEIPEPATQTTQKQ